MVLLIIFLAIIVACFLIGVYNGRNGVFLAMVTGKTNDGILIVRMIGGDFRYLKVEEGQETPPRYETVEIEIRHGRFIRYSRIPRADE